MTSQEKNRKKFTVLFSEQMVQSAVARMAERISADCTGQDIVVIGILTGAFMFTADLARRLTVPASVDFIRASSYGSGTSSSGTVTIMQDIAIDIRGKQVLLLDSIIDTGTTLDRIAAHLQKKEPAAVRIAALLDKRGRRKISIPILYWGFTIGNEFVVGYGMDFQGACRCLPYIAVLPEPSKSMKSK
jgi:hypoxanthine phosphoribosyltransferase